MYISLNRRRRQGEQMWGIKRELKREFDYQSTSNNCISFDGWSSLNSLWGAKNGELSVSKRLKSIGVSIFSEAKCPLLLPVAPKIASFCRLLQISAAVKWLPPNDGKSLHMTATIFLGHTIDLSYFFLRS